MKKLSIVLFTFFLICGMSILSFAQTPQAKTTKKADAKAEVISGKVTSINTAKNEVTVKENKTAVERTITVTAKAVSALKTGDDVKVTLKKGSNTAVSVKKLVKKTVSTK